MHKQCCNACTKTWFINDSDVKDVKLCPFCGEKVIKSKPDSFSSIEECFKFIIENNGLSILSDVRRFMSLLSDYMPKLNVEKRVLKIALEAKVYQSLIGADKSVFEVECKKAISKLINDYALSKEWAEKAIAWINIFDNVAVDSIGESSLRNDNTDAVKTTYDKNYIEKLNLHTDFKFNGTVLCGYTGNKKRVYIPEGVKTIGPRAFYGKSVEEVFIPSSVVNIEKNAFAYCEYLKVVHFSKGLVELGDWAFVNCCALEIVELPNSVKTIGELCFMHCSSLMEVHLSDKLERIEDLTFSGCGKLKKVDIPLSIKYISKSAFDYNCNLIKL